MNERPRAVNCSRDYVVIANSFALVIIPFFALIILNACIYRTINRATRLHNAISSNQRRDHKVWTWRSPIGNRRAMWSYIWLP